MLLRRFDFFSAAFAISLLSLDTLMPAYAAAIIAFSLPLIFSPMPPLLIMPHTSPFSLFITLLSQHFAAYDYAILIR